MNHLMKALSNKVTGAGKKATRAFNKVADVGGTALSAVKRGDEHRRGQTYDIKRAAILRRRESRDNEKARMGTFN
jgi:hypothetical protein